MTLTAVVCNLKLYILFVEKVGNKVCLKCDIYKVVTDQNRSLKLLNSLKLDIIAQEINILAVIKKCNEVYCLIVRRNLDGIEKILQVFCISCDFTAPKTVSSASELINNSCTGQKIWKLLGHKIPILFCLTNEGTYCANIESNVNFLFLDYIKVSRLLDLRCLLDSIYMIIYNSQDPNKIQCNQNVIECVVFDTSSKLIVKHFDVDLFIPKIYWDTVCTVVFETDSIISVTNISESLINEIFITTNTCHIVKLNDGSVNQRGTLPFLDSKEMRLFKNGNIEMLIVLSTSGTCVILERSSLQVNIFQYPGYMIL